jgi:inner membrane protein
VTLPLVLAAIMFAVGKRRGRSDAPEPLSAPWLIALSYIGVLLHVGMDLLNNYGVRLLMPLQSRWFYGDTLFIIDPWLWLMLGGGVWLAVRQRSSTPARGALLAAGLYVAAMVISARAARATVADAWTTVNGRPPVALMVGPMPVTPFSRTVIIDAGDRYATGVFRWPSAEVQFDPQFVQKHAADPRVAVARQAPYVSAFLVWSRFPFWTLVDLPDGGTRVTVGDMRFSGALAGRFTASAVVADE